MTSDVKKVSLNNKRLVPTINKIIEIIKHYFELDLSDEKYEKIFNVLFKAFSATNRFAKKNDLAKKSKDAYKTLLETVLCFFKTITVHDNSIGEN